MLKKVLWLALACAVLLAALALSRGVRFTSEPEKPKAPSVEEAAKPAAEVAPPPKAVEAPSQPTPEELQMQEDAAAVGMMNADPAPESPETDDAAEPPTN
jgi:hypothetical protein